MQSSQDGMWKSWYGVERQAKGCGGSRGSQQQEQGDGDGNMGSPGRPREEPDLGEMCTGTVSNEATAVESPALIQLPADTSTPPSH